MIKNEGKQCQCNRARSETTRTTSFIAVIGIPAGRGRHCEVYFRNGCALYKRHGHQPDKKHKRQQTDDTIKKIHQKEKKKEATNTSKLHQPRTDGEADGAVENAKPWRQEHSVIKVWDWRTLRRYNNSPQHLTSNKSTTLDIKLRPLTKPIERWIVKLL